MVGSEHSHKISAPQLFLFATDPAHRVCLIKFRFDCHALSAPSDSIRTIPCFEGNLAPKYTVLYTTIQYAMCIMQLTILYIVQPKVDCTLQCGASKNNLAFFTTTSTKILALFQRSNQYLRLNNIGCRLLLDLNL